MLIWRQKLKSATVVAAAALLLTSCGEIAYKLPDEYASDGELLAASMRAAVAKFGENNKLVPENGPFVIANLASDTEGYEVLFDSFEDALATELAARGLEVVANAEDNEGATTIKYRLVECRILNTKAGGGRVKRVGRTVAHFRIYGGDELFWAGEYRGEFENVVPKKVVSKLSDERITEIGPQKPEAGQNPFVEPLLVTGITGALIYLFAVSASAQ